MSVTSTLVITKLAAKLSRQLGRGGGQALPGLLADYLDPQLAGKLARQLPSGVVLVTGTNGKTTTTKILVSMLESAGEKVLTNSTGSNLKRGITSAFIKAASVNGQLPHTIGVFEVDEASLRRIAGDVKPRLIVVLNLFRDQLDRYGELDTTAALIGEGIAQTEANLCLNADDPLVAHLAQYVGGSATVSYFGVEGMEAKDTSIVTASDSDRCPVCHERLKFSRTFYGHIGHYACPNNDFRRPHPDVAVTTTSQMDLHGSRFELAISSKRHLAEFGLPGVYNLYNALAAMNAADMLGVAPVTALEVLRSSQAAFGRVERIPYKGRMLCLLLIKNPAGFAQVVQTFLVGRSNLSVMMVINDRDADGRDVSWLWDVPLEILAPGKPRVFVSGIRAGDMAVRLKYAGIQSEGVEDIAAGLYKLLEGTSKGEEVYILPTYTAMTEVRNVLSKLTQIEDVL